MQNLPHYSLFVKIYCISGLGADERVFEQLTLEGECVALRWIDPMPKESIEAYAERLSRAIDKTEEFIVLGVSFGGLIAVEISKLLNPKLTILVSSVETRKELPRLFRWIGKTNLLRFLPVQFFRPPKRILHYLFGTKNKEILNQIIRDSKPSFYKWAIRALLVWKNDESVDAKLKIEGKADKIIPPTHDPKAIVVEGGQHFMIYDKAEEISAIVNAKIGAIRSR